MIRQFMRTLPPTRTTIIEGDLGSKDETIGVDRIAGRIARELGMTLKVYPEHWLPVRNSRILRENRDITLCVAFHDNVPGSKGTQDLMQKCFSHGLRVLLIGHGEQRYVHTLAEAGIPLPVNRKWR